jgi:hypothetical protein
MLDDVLLGKHQHVPDAFVDAVRAAVGRGRKKARQPFLRKVGNNAGRIDADSRRGDRLAVDVGGEDLHGVA